MKFILLFVNIFQVTLERLSRQKLQSNFLDNSQSSYVAQIAAIVDVCI